MKKVLLLDVDGVIADCAGAVHSWAERRFDRDLPPPAKWNTYEFHDCLGLSTDEADKFYRDILDSDVPQSIQLYPGAAQCVASLKSHFEVVFVTSHWKKMPYWVLHRDRLLAQFACDVVYAHNKARVLGDILCDDKVTTIERGGPWKGLLFNRPWNKSSKYPARIDYLWELIGHAEKAA